ncbi:MAG: DEAD/DEAH box helicase, partial [Elusimicrobia bacterium]|nr:DEAD/DEAH box helicase [Elusimicrobiota bacterium]
GVSGRAAQLRIAAHPQSAQAFYLLELLHRGILSRPLLLVTEREEDAVSQSQDLRSLGSFFPSLQNLRTSYFGDFPWQRLKVLEELEANRCDVVFASASSVFSSTLSPKRFRELRFSASVGERFSRERLVEGLEASGYRRTDFAEICGEYALRGSVVDVVNLEPEKAFRIVFDRDVIESLREFDPGDQRTRRLVDSLTLIPAAERGRGPGDCASLREHLPPAFSVAVSGALWRKLSARMRSWTPQVLVWEDFSGPGVQAGPQRRVEPALPDRSRVPQDFGALRVASFGGSLDLAAREIQHRLAEGFRVTLYCPSFLEEERLVQVFHGRGISEESLQWRIGSLSGGFLHPGKKLCVLSSGDLWKRPVASRAWWPLEKNIRRLRSSFGSLAHGDFVVHERYGIARYLGIQSLRDPTTVGECRLNTPLGPGLRDPTTVGECRLHTPLGTGLREEAGFGQDCLVLEFAGKDRLYVPMYDFRLIQKYIGPGARPKLSSLNRPGWERVVDEVRRQVRELAQELLHVAAERKMSAGYAFGPAGAMEREFEEEFPHEETPDQARAIREVLEDMESNQPMERLVLGDVGFGKTEVALRAALRCAAAGKQTALLVPTTLLAEQHFRNFQRRFAPYPIHVERLSRFQARPQTRRILRDLASGVCDIVVGTHRLLSGDVRFKDLGLLVVDEEHRFGVRDKEKLKGLKTGVDVLYLSATPIPRTLYSALSRLKSLSLIQTPPPGRLPIATYLGPFQESVLEEAIRQEVKRAGQVFYVVNRIGDLSRRRLSLERLFPTLRFATAHGRMPDAELERIMMDFLDRRYEVLVTSTIVESGLDIPSVNCLIVEEAQNFGLSQLYQLRGRVGREKQKASCYLFYPARVSWERLSEGERNRLMALKEFTELGSGFQLALRDLEIRGAGNLLGPQQHGFVRAVGLELYSELLREEISQAGPQRRVEPALPDRSRVPQGGSLQREAIRPEPVLDLGVPAYIPESYLPDPAQRLGYYKRLLGAEERDLAELEAELQDLCGPLPAPVAQLFDLVRLKPLMRRSGVQSISERAGRLEILFDSHAMLALKGLESRLPALPELFEGMEWFQGREGNGVRFWGGPRGLEKIQFLRQFLTHAGVKDSRGGV